jgi:hypothetical protein
LAVQQDLNQWESAIATTTINATNPTLDIPEISAGKEITRPTENAKLTVTAAQTAAPAALYKQNSP